MDIEKIISEMTLEEKAGMLSGSDFWHTKKVDRLGVPAIMVSDGPHGLRKQDMEGDHLGVNDSIKAVCFPPACATACSFDAPMMTSVGEAIGESCQHEGLAVDLGPAVNIKRSPLCGRNFEYQSEDPLLAGRMAAAEVRGLQSKHVGASVKHFAGNDQEHRRMTSDSVIDERTLREIYLRAFEIIVKESQPWTVMCSYNKLNGEQVSEDRWLLNDVLRDEWGFKGLVVSDWGAVRDRVKGVHAGLDLEMPTSGGVNDAEIVKAVKEGRLDIKDVDLAVKRVLTLIDEYEENKKPETPWNKDEQHVMAAAVEENCAVLLKNGPYIDPDMKRDGIDLHDPVSVVMGGPARERDENQPPILPIRKGMKVAFIGEFAEHPRYQGGGSSHINSFKVESALDAAKEDGLDVTYAQGYSLDDADSDGDNENSRKDDLLSEAVTAALEADIAVVFAGLPESFESEGYDRADMKMPENQLSLIMAVSAINDNTVVVLHHGSPIEMDWADDRSVKAILDMYLGGQAVGRATVDLLWGKANPSGHLAESIPYHLEDNPSYLYYGGEGDRTEYREGVFVGYRYYDKKNMPVRYPFGYGLSYSEFAITGMEIEAGGSDSALVMDDNATVKVRVKVTNKSHVAGSEVVQLYVGKPVSDVIRPVRELRAFAKIPLGPLETKTVEFALDKSAFAYWENKIHDWYVESGEYVIYAGDSSRRLTCEGKVKLAAPSKLPHVWDDNSTFGDIMDDPEAMKIFAPILESYMKSSSLVSDSDASKDAISPAMLKRMMEYMPVRQLLSFAPGAIGKQEIEALIDKLNEMK